MGGYQGFYENIPFPVTRTMPDRAQLRGDFSQTTTRERHADPDLTTRRRRSCNASVSELHPARRFPGNIIPAGPLEPDRAALLPYIPTAERDAEHIWRARATSSARRTSAATATTRT